MTITLIALIFLMIKAVSEPNYVKSANQNQHNQRNKKINGQV